MSKDQIAFLVIIVPADNYYNSDLHISASKLLKEPIPMRDIPIVTRTLAVVPAINLDWDVIFTN